MLGSIADFGKLRELLLDPTPANLHEVAALLQPLADRLTALKLKDEQCGAVRAMNSSEAIELCATLHEIQREMRRVRSLLSSAAKFYNGLAVAHSAQSYQANGLWNTVAVTGRTLAQL